MVWGVDVNTIHKSRQIWDELIDDVRHTMMMMCQVSGAYAIKTTQIFYICYRAMSANNKLYSQDEFPDSIQRYRIMC